MNDSQKKAIELAKEVLNELSGLGKSVEIKLGRFEDGFSIETIIITAG